MEALLEAERETLKLRLLAIAAVIAGLYMRQEEILLRIEVLYLILGLSTLYLVYTLSLRPIILPRIRTPHVVYGMIIIDVAVLLFAMHLAGGLQSNVFIIFPLVIMFYAIHLDYVSSFFTATVVSFAMAGYAYFAEPEAFGIGNFIAFQIPALFVLAYFSGFLARRATEEREKRVALQEFIRIESGTKGLREVVRVINRTLEIYEEWVDSHASSSPEKEAIEKLQFSLSVDAQYALAHYAFGRTYAETGQLGRAVEAYGKAIALDPNLLESYRGLSEALLRQGRFQEALEPALKYAEGSQHDWVAYQNLVVIYDELNMAEECDQAQRRALAVSTGEDKEALETFFTRMRALKAPVT